jgi:hypothetical protein
MTDTTAADPTPWQLFGTDRRTVSSLDEFIGADAPAGL